jgi:hypothetical protein
MVVHASNSNILEAEAGGWSLKLGLHSEFQVIHSYIDPGSKPKSKTKSGHDGSHL